MWRLPYGAPGLTLIAAVWMSSSCGGPATPSVIAPVVQLPVVQLPEPTPPNAPPVITSLTPSSPRSEAGQTVELVATIEDRETPTDRLTFAWSADKGTFEGQGARVTWRAPATEPTPAAYDLTLTVIERYVAILEDHTSAEKENRVSAEVTIHVNDSPGEVRDLALLFLSDFSNSSVSADRAVRNFSSNCPGKDDELSDIQVNRQVFVILSSQFSIANLSFNGDRTRADIAAPCEFTSRARDTGRQGTARGTCLLTAVYEAWHWWLCDSRFSGTADPLSMFWRRRRF